MCFSYLGPGLSVASEYVLRMSLSGRWDSLREKRNKHLLERFEQIGNGWVHQWWDSFPWGQLKWRTLFCFPRVPAYWTAGHSSNFRVGDEIFSILDTICFLIKLYWWFSWIFFNSKHLTHFKCLHVWLGTEEKGWTAIIYLALTTFSSGYKHSFYESSDSGQRQIQLRLLAEVGKKGWF